MRQQNKDLYSLNKVLDWAWDLYLLVERHYNGVMLIIIFILLLVSCETVLSIQKIASTIKTDDDKTAKHQ